MNEDAKCLQRFHSLLVEQIEKARSTRSEGGLDASKEKEESHCCEFTSPAHHGGPLSQPKTTPHPQSLFNVATITEYSRKQKRGGEGEKVERTKPCRGRHTGLHANSDFAVNSLMDTLAIGAQSPRKRKAQITIMTSNNTCLDCSPQKIFIIAATAGAGDGESTASSLEGQLSDNISIEQDHTLSKDDILENAQDDLMQHITPSPTNCKEIPESQTPISAAAHTAKERSTSPVGRFYGENFNSESEISSAAAYCVDNGTSSEAYSFVCEDTNCSTVDTSSQANLGISAKDVDVALRFQTTGASEDNDNMHLHQDSAVEDKSQSLENGDFVEHFEILTSRKQDTHTGSWCSAENMTHNTGGAKNESPNTDLGYETMGANKSLSPSVYEEWDYECDFINRHLSPIRSSRDQVQLTLLQELQQAEQQQQQHGITADTCNRDFEHFQRQPQLSKRKSLKGPLDSSQATTSQQDKQKTHQTAEKDSSLIQHKQEGSQTITACGSTPVELFSQYSDKSGDSETRGNTTLPPDQETPTVDCIDLHQSNVSKCSREIISSRCDDLEDDKEESIPLDDTANFDKIACEVDKISFDDTESPQNYVDCSGFVGQANISELDDVFMMETTMPAVEVLVSAMPDEVNVDQIGSCHFLRPSVSGHCICFRAKDALETEKCANVPGSTLLLETPMDTSLLEETVHLTSLQVPDTRDNYDEMKTNSLYVGCSSEEYDDGKGDNKRITNMHVNYQRMDESSKNKPDCGTVFGRQGCEEQVARCLLTVNNNSLPSQGKSATGRSPQVVPKNDLCLAEGDDYLLEYICTRKGNPSASYAQPRARIPRTDYRYTEGKPTGRTKRQHRSSLQSSLTANLDANTVITKVRSAGKHPQECKCLDYDCLRRRGEILHDHVMRNLHELRKCTVDQPSIYIKEAVGAKARELIKRQRSALRLNSNHLPPDSTFTRSFHNPNRASAASERILPTSSLRSRQRSKSPRKQCPSYPDSGLFSPSKKNRPKSATNKRKGSSSLPSKQNVTSCAHGLGYNGKTTRPCLAKTIGAFGNTDPEAEYQNFFTAMIDKLKDTLCENSEYVVTEVLDRLCSLKQADEACERLIRQLEERKQERTSLAKMTVNRRRRDWDTTCSSSSRCRKADWPPCKSGGEDGAVALPLRDNLPQNYFLSVEVPNPKLPEKSLFRFNAKPKANSKALSCEMKQVTTKSGPNTVTHELVQREYNPSSKKTMSYYYSLSQEADESVSREGNEQLDSTTCPASTCYNGEESTRTDGLDSLFPFPAWLSSQTQTSPSPSVNVAVQTSDTVGDEQNDCSALRHDTVANIGNNAVAPHLYNQTSDIQSAGDCARRTTDCISSNSLNKEQMPAGIVQSKTEVTTEFEGIYTVGPAAEQSSVLFRFASNKGEAVSCLGSPKDPGALPLRSDGKTCENKVNSRTTSEHVSNTEPIGQMSDAAVVSPPSPSPARSASKTSGGFGRTSVNSNLTSDSVSPSSAKNISPPGFRQLETAIVPTSPARLSARSLVSPPLKSSPRSPVRSFEMASHRSSLSSVGGLCHISPLSSPGKKSQSSQLSSPEKKFRDSPQVSPAIVSRRYLLPGRDMVSRQYTSSSPCFVSKNIPSVGSGILSSNYVSSNTSVGSKYTAPPSSQRRTHSSPIPSSGISSFHTPFSSPDRKAHRNPCDTGQETIQSRVTPPHIYMNNRALFDPSARSRASAEIMNRKARPQTSCARNRPTTSTMNSTSQTHGGARFKESVSPHLSVASRDRLSSRQPPIKPRGNRSKSQVCRSFSSSCEKDKTSSSASKGKQCVSTAGKTASQASQDNMCQPFPALSGKNRSKSPRGRQTLAHPVPVSSVLSDTSEDDKLIEAPVFSSGEQLLSLKTAVLTSKQSLMSNISTAPSRSGLSTSGGHNQSQANLAENGSVKTMMLSTVQLFKDHIPLPGSRTSKRATRTGHGTVPIVSRSSEPLPKSVFAALVTPIKSVRDYIFRSKGGTSQMPLTTLSSSTTTLKKERLASNVSTETAISSPHSLQPDSSATCKIHCSTLTHDSCRTPATAGSTVARDIITNSSQSSVEIVSRSANSLTCKAQRSVVSIRSSSRSSVVTSSRVSSGSAAASSDRLLDPLRPCEESSQRACGETGGNVLVRLVLTLRHFLQRVTGGPSSSPHVHDVGVPSRSATVAVGALVAMATGGYLCGCHVCCPVSLTLQSSLRLELLLEDLAAHLGLRHLGLPPL